MNFAAAFELDFQGPAMVPLELDIPVPAGMDTTNRSFLLGHLGNSTRGPRIMIVDTLTVVNGKFTTRDTTGSSALHARSQSTQLSSNETTILGKPVKSYLLRVLESGRYNISDLRVPPGASPGWAYFDLAQDLLELFWGLYHSLYVEHFYLTEGHGRVVVPVVSGRPFTVEGVDISSGLTTFTKAYDPLPTFAPGTTVSLPSPDIDSRVGPYPVYGGPFRIETIDLAVDGVALTSVRDFSVTLSGNTALVTRTSNPNVNVLVTAQVINVSNGASMYGSGPLTVPAAVGDHLVLLIGEYDVDPSSPISVVFNEPIALDDISSNNAVDTSIRKLIKLQQSVNNDWVDISAQPHFSADSGFRRVLVSLSGELQRGQLYRLKLSRDITDNVTGTAPPLKLGQTTAGASLPDAAYLPFSVRDPQGSLTGQYLLADGVVRDLALDGNVLLVSALDGGLQAFDTSDPGGMANNPPIATAKAPPGGGAMWGLATDHHGRIFSTQLSSMFGILRSYRVKDFTAGGEPPIISSAIVSWATGIDAGVPLGVTVTTISDRPEATPRKLQIDLIDDVDTFQNRADFEQALAMGTVVVGATGSAGMTYGDFNSYSIQISASADNPYLVQTATVENLTLGLRWTEDIKLSSGGASSVFINGVLVRSGDQVRISRNRSTYAVVSLFGYGVGVFDVNAMESNSLPNPPSSYNKASTMIGLTDGAAPVPCNDIDLIPTGFPCPIKSLNYTPEASVVARADQLTAYALESTHGLLDVNVTANPDPSTGSRLNRGAGGGLVLTTTYVDAGHFKHWDTPRLRALRAQTRPDPLPLIARFSSISRYTRPSDKKNFALVAAAQFGLLVIDLDQALDATALADIIWIPAGAYGVRVIPGSHLATAVDGEGRMLLIDLSRIDERDQMQPPNCGVTPMDDCSADLFPTVKKAIASGGDPTAIGFGSDDPRILWKSDPNGTFGTLAPVADPDTGIVYTGALMTKIMNTIAAVDPHMRVKADLGSGPVDVGAITPLGIKPLGGVLKCDVTVDPNCRGSLAAFRVEVALPGGASLSASVPFAIESERVPGVVAQQTPDGFPRSSYRLTVPPGTVEPRPSTDFNMQHVVPITTFPQLRWQRGYNRWVSPWVVAIADPRASVLYTAATAQQKKDAGCDACSRPQYLQSDPSVLELWSNGRTIRVRPDSSSTFLGKYSYLSDNKNRLVLRFGTIMADLSRPSDDKVAAQNVAPNGDQKQAMVHLHDGEVEAGGTDMAIKGRGLDFVMNRSYSSAIFHLGPLGRNFDSTLFARMRALPDGSVDYFDGSGRRDHFASNGDGTFAPPAGIFYDLARRADGSYVLTDVNRTRLVFDPYGRLAQISDRNRTKADASDGNTMYFLYNGDSILSTVVDATGRQIQLAYYPDKPYLLHTITDFDGRMVTYVYYPDDRLQTVTGPDPQSALSAQQSTLYLWSTAASGGELKSLIYTGNQITSEKDGLGRTVYSVGYQSGSNAWAAQTLTMGGGAWNFAPSGSDLTVTDPNGHDWKYTHDDFGNVTAEVAPPVGTSGTATTSYGYDGKQRLTSITPPLGDQVIYGYGGSGEGMYRKDGNIASITQQPRNGSAEKAAGITRVTTAAYGAANQITSLVDPDGGSTVVTRDSRGNPSTIATAAGSSTLVFDELGRISSVTTPRTGLISYSYFTGPNSGYVNTAQNAAGSRTYSVDPRGNITSDQDPSGHTKTFSVNKLDQVETEQRGQSTVVTTFDAAGNPSNRNTLTAFQSSGEPIYSTSTFAFDAQARLRMRSDNDMVANYGFDNAGNLSTVTRTASAPVTYGYDARNRQVSVMTSAGTTTANYDDDDALMTDSDALGQQTSYSSDGFGHHLMRNEPASAAEITQTNAAGKPVDVRSVKTLANGTQTVLRWTQSEYDPSGRLRREVKKLFAGTLDLPSTGDIKTGFTDAITTVDYDDEHNRVTTTDPLGHSVIKDYDALGRERLETDALGNSIETTYTPAGFTLERLVTAKRPDGTASIFRTRYEYDDRNRVVAVVDLSDPAAPAETRYEYDLRGNVVAEIQPEGQTSRFEYDLRGFKTKVTDPMGGVTAYRYDEAGRVIGVTDPDGNPTSFAYDDQGNLTREVRVDGATWTYTYDASNDRRTATDPNGTTVTFTYDGAHRLAGAGTQGGSSAIGAASVTITRDDLGRAVRYETDQGVISTATFDSADREVTASTQIPESSARLVTREFDAAGNVTVLTTPSGARYTYGYDALNRLARIADGAGLAVATYADFGTRLLSRATANAVTQTRVYDARGRLTGVNDASDCHPLPCSPSPLSTFAYVRSLNGLKTASVRDGRATRFAYDANFWLRQVDDGVSLSDPTVQPSGSRSYDWDGVLNLKAISTITPKGVAGVRSFGHNGRNQYTTAGDQNPQYDRSGNLTVYRGLTMRYDAQNQLGSAVSGSASLSVMYDALGRKVEERVTDGTGSHKREYVADGDRVIEEYLDGALAARIVNGRGPDEIVRVETPNGTTGYDYAYPLQDELGTVNAVTDAQGNLVEQYHYDDFGLPTRQSIAGDPLPLRPSWRWLFEGREYQSVLGAYDFRSRTLWPDLARFGQEDPAGMHDSTNLYQAFLGRPTDITDPTGRTINEDEVNATTFTPTYVQSRTGLQKAPLGRTLWDRLDATFPVFMKYDPSVVGKDGAVTERNYDSSGAYTWATIRFGDPFGKDVANDAKVYPNAIKVWNSYTHWPLTDNTPYLVYSLAHELGHVLWGLDPATAARARFYNQRRDEHAAKAAAYRKKQAKHPIVPGKPVHTFEGLAVDWESEFLIEPIHTESEHYADDVGYAVYLSFKGKPANLPFTP
jgi:RHS repeat-associated protein